VPAIVPTTSRRGAKPLVAILHQEVPEDAPADERDTSVQVEAVEGALRALGYGTERLMFDLDLAPVVDRLRTLTPAVVFNLVESAGTEARLASLAPALLEALDIPFTGNCSRGLRLTGDKLRGKRTLRDAGLPTPDWRMPDDLDGNPSLPPGPWILKPVSEDASVGLDSQSALVESARLAEALHACRYRDGGAWLAERYVEGRELNIPLLQGETGPQVLPVAEIRFLDFPRGLPRILDYAAKWEPESFAYRHTQRCFDFDPTDAPMLRRLEDLGRACWDLFDLAGYARVDVRLDAEGAPWILEVNANPCLAPDAGFIAAARQAELGIEEVVERLVRVAIHTHVSHP
jgi:D-alanine-D-alanine ligase